MGAEAQIEEINFPSELNPGDLIFGEITLKNVGDEVTSEPAGYFGVLITTKWDGEEHTLFAYATVPPGETFTFHYQMSIGKMPESDAELEVIGRVWLPLDGVFRNDDIKIWSIVIRSTASLSGYIEDAENQLPISAVLIECKSLSTTTDILGRYKFEEIPLSICAVYASAAGYAKQYKSLDATTPGAYILNFRMKEAAPMSMRKVGAAITAIFLSIVAVLLGSKKR